MSKVYGVAKVVVAITELRHVSSTLTSNVTVYDVYPATVPIRFNL
jgi:hypothetical protein